MSLFYGFRVCCRIYSPSNAGQKRARYDFYLLNFRSKLFLTLNTLTWVYRFFVQFSLHSYRTDKENLFSNQELLQLKFNFIFSKNLSGEIHQIETSWVSWQHSGNSLKMKRKECSSKWIILRLWYDLLSFFFSLSNLKYTCMCHTVVCTILKLSLCWKPLYL